MASERADRRCIPSNETYTHTVATSSACTTCRGNNGNCEVGRETLNGWLSSCPSPRLATFGQMFFFACSLVVLVSSCVGLLSFPRPSLILPVQPAAASGVELEIGWLLLLMKMMIHDARNHDPKHCQPNCGEPLWTEASACRLLTKSAKLAPRNSDALPTKRPPLNDGATTI